MQVTELQVQRSLRALTGDEATAGETSADQPESAQPAPGAGRSDEACPDGLVEALVGASSIRDDRLAEVRRRLETGVQPSPEDLAQRMVGRLVCDRLR